MQIASKLRTLCFEMALFGSENSFASLNDIRLLNKGVKNISKSPVPSFWRLRISLVRKFIKYSHPSTNILHIRCVHSPFLFCCYHVSLWIHWSSIVHWLRRTKELTMRRDSNTKKNLLKKKFPPFVSRIQRQLSVGWKSRMVRFLVRCELCSRDDFHSLLSRSRSFDNRRVSYTLQIWWNWEPTKSKTFQQ